MQVKMASMKTFDTCFPSSYLADMIVRIEISSFALDQRWVA